MYRLKHSAVLLILTSCLSPVTLAVAPKASLLCVITNVTECEILKGCVNVLPASVNLPTFFNIDFKQQVVMAEGAAETINHIDFTPEGIVLQGIGNQHRAWSLLLNNEQTKVTGHVTGQHYGFTLFGLGRAEN